MHEYKQWGSTGLNTWS